MRRAILLAGGRGTRLDPVTRAVNKHLLPIYDRPMICFPLATLAAMGVEETLLVTNGDHLAAFRALLGDQAQGVRLRYAVQPRPGGIAEGVLLGAEFTHGEPFALALGDQLFLGPGQGCLRDPFRDGARVFVQDAPSVEDYAVLELDGAGPRSIEEKPARPRSSLAVTGLYLLDGRAVDVAATLAPSERGELEVVDLLRWYLERGELDWRILPPTVTWSDLGTFDRLLAAARAVQRQQSEPGWTASRSEEMVG